jgi:hypothetical protein
MIGSIGTLARHDLLNDDRAVLRPGGQARLDSFLVSAMPGHGLKGTKPAGLGMASWPGLVGMFGE